MSIGSTLGFTGLDGLPMGTRCGQIDPGVILYLMHEQGMSLEDVEDLLYNPAGLKGLSGLSNDMRDLLASGQPGAKLAIDYFVYRIGCELGSLAAALGGLDALVFTAGIGEHAAPVRARVCRDTPWLGVSLDEEANLSHGPRISTDGRVPSVWVIPTNEELMIARHTLRLVSTSTVPKMAVIKPTTEGLVLRGGAPEVSVSDVVSATAAKPIIPLTAPESDLW